MPDATNSPRVYFRDSPGCAYFLNVDFLSDIPDRWVQKANSPARWQERKVTLGAYLFDPASLPVSRLDSRRRFLGIIDLTCGIRGRKNRLARKLRSMTTSSDSRSVVPSLGTRISHHQIVGICTTGTGMHPASSLNCPHVRQCYHYLHCFNSATSG